MLYIKGDEGLERRDPNVWMWFIWHWPARQRRTEGARIAWCCQPRRMERGQHPKLLTDMEGWMSGCGRSGYSLMCLFVWTSISRTVCLSSCLARCLSPSLAFFLSLLPLIFFDLSSSFWPSHYLSINLSISISILLSHSYHNSPWWWKCIYSTHLPQNAFCR